MLWSRIRTRDRESKGSKRGERAGGDERIPRRRTEEFQHGRLKDGMGGLGRSNRSCEGRKGEEDKIPESLAEFPKFLLLLLLAHSAFRSSPARSFIWLGRGSLSRWPRSGYLLLPSFSPCKERESREVGRNGSGEGMSGHGWRRGGKRKKGGGDRYLSGLEEDGGEERGLEEV